MGGVQWPPLHLKASSYGAERHNFKNVVFMEPMEWIALIGGILSLLGVGTEIWQTNKANKQQREHDEAMAALNHRYREEEAISSMEREANYNQYEIEKNKMLEAGFSPSLMYGQMQTAVPNISSVGSSQGAGNVGRMADFSKFFGKLDPAEYSGQMIERMNAKTLQERTRSDILKNEQDIRESVSRTIENKRNTAFKKSLETTLFNQEQQTLNNLRLQNKQMDFDLQYNIDTRDIRIEKERLENKRLEKQINMITLEIEREPLVRKQIATDVSRMAAATENYYAQTAATKEQTQGMQITRIMKEFGLSARTIPVNARAGKIHDALWSDNMNAARIALKQLGFSEFEATNAVLWYVAEDPKDVTPSLVNGFSRWLSASSKK